MFNIKELTRAIEQIAQEKGIDVERVQEAIESSIAAAYKKEYGHRGEIVRAKVNPKTGDLKFWQVKTVVDESLVRIVPEGEEGEADEPNKGGAESESFEDRLPRYNPDRHILWEDAKKISASSWGGSPSGGKGGSASGGKKDIALGEELEFPLETKSDFGRIAAQTAKQVVLQKLREAERQSVISEFQNKEGMVVSGMIQRFERGNVYVDLGRAVGVMFGNESVPGEHYRIGERLRFYVVAVQEDAKLPGIVLSRSHPQFVAKLFEMEVPEIADGVVEIKAIAREPGSRTKIAVVSHADGVDPVGSCVGQRGTRVMAVNNELGQEKIDIIEWAESPEKFIAHALSPAKAKSVEISDRREARVYVPEDQLSLAIGKGGQNVRLAAKLTGWKIDVRSLANPEEPPAETDAGAGNL
ncbi:MAG: transcription termination factor NusA [bacterium]|nr:transcription termination factor NusA [bacterium]